jgi:predicted S18 family serine protease
MVARPTLGHYQIYSLLARIQILSSDEVKMTATALTDYTLALFSEKKEESKEKNETKKAEGGHPRTRFTEAAKTELNELKRNA